MAAHIRDLPIVAAPSRLATLAIRVDLLFRRPALIAAVMLLGLVSGVDARADVITLKDGRVLEGTVATLGEMANDPTKGTNQNQPGFTPIVMVDDDLRRTYVPNKQVAQVNVAGHRKIEKIRIPQRVVTSGARIGHVGDVLAITPFDAYGRRTFSMSSEIGRLDVIQGITLITPLWTKVEGLVAGKQPFVWDCRLATSSIPRETLNAIVARQIDPKNIDQRRLVSKLFLQAERFTDAQVEVEALLNDFPRDEGLKTLVRELKQLNARRILDEIALRRKVAQPRLAQSLLEDFPREDIAGETLQQVRELLAEFAQIKQQGVDIVTSLKARADELREPSLARRSKAAVAEIKNDLAIDTLDRMSGYIRLGADDKLGNEDKLALAISGWLVGGNDAITNLPVALSMLDVRELATQYLNEPLTLKREELLRQIKSQEAGSPSAVAAIIAHMKPPIPTPEPPAETPGFYELSTPGLDGEPPTPYYVQLPPEYDPYHRYPTIITLNGAGTRPSHQLDWWAGGRDANGMRRGQAMRNGYIVVAIDWIKEGQKSYGYSAREHHTVLSSLRDACRRFSIDTDRVYLSGHSMGGDAAWDLALAHPDLWAGVIPIVARGDKYCALYWTNGALVPFYFVGGELDGDKTVVNAKFLDRYFRSQSMPFDVTVVEYLGRGHEHFSDEIQRIFEWMGKKERNFAPRSINAVTMRPWDNFFYWMQLDELPPAGIVLPADWPPKRGFHPVTLDASIKGNTITVRTGARKVSVWLTPDMVDFNQPIKVTVNAQKIKTPGRSSPGPDLETLLEDVRTRGERLRPFWVKID